MKTAAEIYEPSEWGWGDYQPMLEAFGNIVHQEDDADYQGDTRVLYQDDNRYGYLCFGWGSCSGCDSLQACSSIREVQDLMDNLKTGIIWFDSAKEALKWFESHDWEGDFCFSPKFVTECKEILRMKS